MLHSRLGAITGAGILGAGAAARRAHLRTTQTRAFFDKLFGGANGGSSSGPADAKEPSGVLAGILGSARAPRRRGCPLGPSQAPEGLEIARFAGGEEPSACNWGLGAFRAVGTRGVMEE